MDSNQVDLFKTAFSVLIGLAYPNKPYSSNRYTLTKRQNALNTELENCLNTSDEELGIFRGAVVDATIEAATAAFKHQGLKPEVFAQVGMLTRKVSFT